MTSSAPIQIPHSFFVKLVIGLLITVSHLLHFIFCQKNAPLHTPSTKIQKCPRAGLQIKSARIPIFSDLTIEILTLTFPTRWQKRAVIHLIFYFYNIYNQFCPECIQVERTWDLVRDSGQRKLTYSSQNHCTSSRSVYLSRRLNSHWKRFVITHHLQKWESQLRLR